MNIFIDTNIFLDVALQRKNFKNSLFVLNSVKKGLFSGFILDITLLNIAYIAKKQTHSINTFISEINQTFNVVCANNQTFTQALALKHNDLEDAVQYICAKQNDCKVIVTNDKTFYSDNIKTLSAKAFKKHT